MIYVLIFLSSMLSKHIYCDIKTKFSNNYDYLVLGVGHCGFILPKPANQSAIFALKYMGKSFLLDYLKPVGAILINTQGAIYSGIGLAFDFSFFSSFCLTFGSTFGVYYKGHGKDLGGTAEFRDFIEISFLSKSQSRIGFELGHFSNANIYKKNPGINTLMLNYSLPLKY